MNHANTEKHWMSWLSRLTPMHVPGGAPVDRPVPRIEPVPAAAKAAQSDAWLDTFEFKPRF